MLNKAILLLTGATIIVMPGCGPKSDSVPMTGPIPGFGPESEYMIHYGDWEERHIRYAENFNLAILHPFSNITAEMVLDIKDGQDNQLGTEDDVWVVGYVSIGEEHPGDIVPGNGTGPVTWNGTELVYKHLGAASYYLDADNDDTVDVNGTWKSYYVNAGDSEWQMYLKQRDKGLDYIMSDLGCDGFFMDTIDSASPWHTYSWMLPGMSDCIRQIREWYPRSVMIANRGLFYFYDNEPAYKYNIRQYVNAVMFESFYTGWDWERMAGTVNPWFETSHKAEAAPHLNREAALPDGFTVICLDYLDPEQPDFDELYRQQAAEVAGQPGWLNCITDKIIRSGLNLTVPVQLAETDSGR